MKDLIKVNILSSGRIPWMGIYGPRYGISISKRLYVLLKNDPNVRLEVVDDVASVQTGTPVVNNKFKVSDSIEIKKVEPEIVAVETSADIVDPIIDEVVEEDITGDTTVVDEVVEEDIIGDTTVVDEVVEPDVTEDVLDDEIDAAIEQELEEAIVEEFPDTAADVMKEENTEDPVISVDYKIYTKEELAELSKEQLKTILSVERSITSGPDAPKYADNKTILTEKILRTQG